jgi:MFS family permease
MKLDFNDPRCREKLAISIFFFISGFSFSSWASRIPELQSQLKLNDAELGSLLILLPAGLIITMPLTAFLLSKYTSHKIMLIASLLYVFLLALLGIAKNIWQIACILFLFGAARNLFNISVNTQAVGFQDANSKPIMSSFHGIWSIAGFTGAALSSLLISMDINVTTHFNLVCLISLVCILFNHKNTLKTDVKKYNTSTSLLFPNKALLKLGIIAFFSMVCEATISEWGVIYFIKVVQVPKSLTTFGYLAYLSSMTLGRFLGDKLTNQFGAISVLKKSGFLAFVGIGIIVLFPNLVVATIGYFIIGLGLSCIIPLIYSIAGKHAALNIGPSITSISTIGYMGFLTGPPLVGFLSQSINMRVSFIVVIVSTFAIFILSGRVKSDQKPKTSFGGFMVLGNRFLK